MIIKEVDDKTQIIKTLKGLLYHPKLFDSVKEKLKREIYMIENESFSFILPYLLQSFSINP